MTENMHKQGLAKQTASIEYFLNTCPAVLRFGARGDGHGSEQGEKYFWFDFDPSVEVPLVPSGVWFDLDTMTDQEREEWLDLGRYAIYAVADGNCNTVSGGVIASTDDLAEAKTIAAAQVLPWGAAIIDRETELIDFGHGFGVAVPEP